MTWTGNADPLERRAAVRSDRRNQYERMYEIRLFEESVNADFAQGLIHGTTHLCNGQEALAVGVAAELEPDDVVAATYRGHGMALALGMTIESVLGEIMGKAVGCAGGVGGSMHLSAPEVGLLPTFAIVGAGLPVAAGAALSFQVRETSQVAVAVFGDGATNIGAFHEALNLASIWKLPVVFVCDNNVYGEYTRIDLSTPIEDLYLRAQAYAMPSVSIDGMVVDEVRAALAEAVDRARDGGGPSMIEAKTYRFAGHSRADKAEYRPDGELDRWRERDPLTLARQDLLTAGIATEVEIGNLEERVADDLRAVRDRVVALPSPDVSAMFSNVWAAANGVPA